MNENETTSVETYVDEDWGEISLADEAEETTTTTETEAETDDNAENEVDQQSDSAKEEQEENDAESAESFVLKHLGTEQTVGRDEVIALAQKGLDYSRIRDKLQTSETEKSEIAEKLSIQCRNLSMHI